MSMPTVETTDTLALPLFHFAEISLLMRESCPTDIPPSDDEITLLFVFSDQPPKDFLLTLTHYFSSQRVPLCDSETAGINRANGEFLLFAWLGDEPESAVRHSVFVSKAMQEYSIQNAADCDIRIGLGGNDTLAFYAARSATAKNQVEFDECLWDKLSPNSIETLQDAGVAKSDIVAANTRLKNDSLTTFEEVSRLDS